MSDPAVSVVMSALNAERTIGIAIGSIFAQTFGDLELIVIDDGSTDGTRAVVRSFGDSRLVFVDHEVRKGLATRLNEGVALARGAYIARMDADDIAYPERLEKQHAFMQVNPTVDLVGCAAMAFKGVCDLGVLRVTTEHAGICAWPARGFDIPHPTWFGRRAFFRKFPYDARAMRAQDQDLLLRAHREARFANLADVLLGYRQERVTASNVARGRLQYCRSIVRTWGPERAYGQLVRGVATQTLRAVVAVPMLVMGFGEYLVSRRFRLASEVEKRVWSDIARQLHEKENRYV